MIKENKKAIFFYFNLIDQVNLFNISIIKHFDIKDLICFINNGQSELNINSRKYIKYLIERKLELICRKYNLNLIKIPLIDNKLEDAWKYKKISRNFLYSVYRNNEILETNNVKKQIDKLSIIAKNTEISLKSFLKNNPYKEVFIFNNRMPMGKAASIACEKCNIDFYTYDCLPGTRIHYAKNSYVLDSENFKIYSEKELAEISKSELKNIGEKFIEKKVNSITIGNINFTKHQVQKSLPLGLKKKYLCVFTNSEDELRYFGDILKFPFFEQVEEIKKLSKLAKVDGIQVVVRIHPNQSKMDLEKKLIYAEEFEDNNLLIVEGASKYDTYELMKKSIGNISFGSSTSFESILLKKNSYLMGKTIHDKIIKLKQFSNINSCYEQILFDLENNINISEVEYISACKWASYFSGEFAPVMLKSANFEKKMPSNFLLYILDKLYRLDRFLGYPFSVKNMLLKKKIHAFIKKVRVYI